jgi:hypothetical protein
VKQRESKDDESAVSRGSLTGFRHEKQQLVD